MSKEMDIEEFEADFEEQIQEMNLDKNLKLENRKLMEQLKTLQMKYSQLEKERKETIEPTTSQASSSQKQKRLSEDSTDKFAEKQKKKEDSPDNNKGLQENKRKRGTRGGKKRLTWIQNRGRGRGRGFRCYGRCNVFNFL
ncbi:RNA-binding protein 27-like [Pseudomyrmex gracilis]|uniref:RNA-binding protein 27-like n=1 Tax=Pseudomyrmex gracilis TaxID=219809 RepID=UPI000994EB15|nr:RNA-binding protein 27-like [Pseudomyrmex gracilis]